MNFDNQSPSENTDGSDHVRRAIKIVGSGVALAERLGVTPVSLNNWASGKRPVPIIRCVEIEEITGGQVTRKQLRPDDWHQIWPELRNQKPLS